MIVGIETLSKAKNLTRKFRTLTGSPENRRTPVPPSQRVLFNGQQYNNLPQDIVMAMERVQALEQASARTRGSSSGLQRGQANHPMTLVSYKSLFYTIPTPF